MNINTTVAGQIIFLNFLVMLYLTLKFAKGKSDNLPLVGFYTFLLVGYIVGTGQKRSRK